MNPRRPFDPARLPFFYGWVIVGAGTIGMMASVPGQTMGVSVFTDYLIEATGLDRLGVANTYLVGTIASGLVLPYGGKLFDRFGARVTAMGACVGVGLVLIVMAHIDQLGRALASAIGDPGWWTIAAVLALGFMALRFTGQGMLSMVSRAMVGKWFDKRRGFAAAVMAVFVSFTFAIAPRVFLAWVDGVGWRDAWTQIGVLEATVMAGLAYVFFRDNPEDVGLRMDGAPALAEGEEEVAGEDSKTRGEAIRTARFWMVALALAAQALIITGIVFHIVDIGELGGLTKAESVGIFVPMAVVNTMVGFTGGLFIDRMKIRWFVLLMALGHVVGLLGTASLDTNLGRIACVGGMSLAGGLFAPISTVAYPRFFGREHLGAISGTMMMVIVISSAIGPSAFALSRSITGSYGSTLMILLVLPALVALVALVSKEDPP